MSLHLQECEWNFFFLSCMLEQSSTFRDVSIFQVEIGEDETQNLKQFRLIILTLLCIMNKLSWIL